jgi:hypothetical protein
MGAGDVSIDSVTTSRWTRTSSSTVGRLLLVVVVVEVTSSMRISSTSCISINRNRDIPPGLGNRRSDSFFDGRGVE